MRRVWLVLSLLVAVSAMASVSAQAQFGVGAKVPPLVLPNLFVSTWAGDNLLLEGTATLAAFGGASSISAGVNAKLYFDALTLGDFALHPFAGAGGTVSLVSVNFLGVNSSSLIIGLGGVGGLEYRFTDFPLSVFLELGVGLSLDPFGFGFGGDLGVRYEFSKVAIE